MIYNKEFMNSIKQKIIIKGVNFPEGPFFDFEGNLWFVEIKGGTLAKWDGQKLERFEVDGTPCGSLMDRKGKIWFCDSARGEIRIFDPVTKEIKTVCSHTDKGAHLKKPNDILLDSHGNLLFSDHANGREEPVSTVCVLPYGGSRAKVISSDKYFTNGLAFMKDGKTLIFSETYRQQLWKAEWDSVNLLLKNECHFAKAGKGPWGPDGIAFDEDENLYAAVFNEYRINIYNKSGKLTDYLSCSGSRPTSCAFDPYGRYGLVVTEAQLGEIISYDVSEKGLLIFN